jgi:imidazolonepropionase-like amidohydrolase
VSRTPIALLLMLLTLLPSAAAQSTRESDLAEARALFERNIDAIQRKDREGYLACYLAEDGLVRGGPDGPALGYADLETGTAATGSDDWPEELRAHDIQLHWLAPGFVYGSYRYQVSAGGLQRAGLSERVLRKTDTGWRIVVSTAFDSPPGTSAAPLALVGATLLDGTGAPAVRDSVVVLRDGRIEAAGPRATTVIPAGVEVVDLAGRFLAPGLIDTHVHYSQTGWADGRPDARDVTERYPFAEVIAELERHPERFHRAFLASGVTAVFDVGGFPWTRRLGAATENDPLAPHVVATGPLLATWVPDALRLPERNEFVFMESEAGVRAAVASAKAGGADAVKVWFVVTDADAIARNTPLVQAAGAACRELDIPLVVHATELEAARVAVQAGASLLVHSVDDEQVDDAFIQALLDGDVSYCPTLTVVRGYLALYGGEIPAHLEHALDELHPDIAARVRETPSLGMHPAFDADRLARRKEAHAETERLMGANLARLHAAGVRVVAGTDAGNPLTLHGPSMLLELLAMQEAGLSAADVLVSATSAAAVALGRDDLGRIAAGQIADLLVLTRDPSDDIANLASLSHVVRAGSLHTRTTLVPD